MKIHVGLDVGYGTDNTHSSCMQRCIKTCVLHV